MQPHVVIAGGGFGGIEVARALRGRAVRITLVDRHNYYLFQPLLYQVATAGLSPGDIASPIRWMLRRQENVRVILGNVEAVDTGRRALETDVGDIAYDFLVLATGAAHSYFGHEEWEQWAPGLKTLDDALAMRRRVLLAFEQAERETDAGRRRRLLTFVVVGGGPTGVELAGALAEISRHTLARQFRTFDPRTARIILIEAGPDVLPLYPAGLRAAAERSLVRLGVEVRKGAPVTAIGPDNVTAGGDRVEAGTVIWAAGVAASRVARSLGVPLDRAGRIVVDRDLSVPGRPEVFAVGDLAAFVQDGQPLPGVAQVAMQQGRHAARVIGATLDGHGRPTFRYRNYGNMATIGRAAAIADLGWLRLSGWVAWVAWLFLHIMKLVGFRNRLGVLLQWTWAYFTYQRSVRLITGDTRADRSSTNDLRPASQAARDIVPDGSSADAPRPKASTRRS